MWLNSTIIGSGVEDTSDNNDSDEEFYEIITSEGESFVTSDEEDAEFLQVALENAYTCSPLKQTRDPAEMSSYLLLDKDFCEDDDLGICLLSLLVGYMHSFGFRP